MTKVRMSNKAREAATDLAISYSSYNNIANDVYRARKENRLTADMLDSLATWARMLADDNEVTGTELGGSPRSLRIYAFNRTREADGMRAAA